MPRGVEVACSLDVVLGYAVELVPSSRGAQHSTERVSSCRHRGVRGVCAERSGPAHPPAGHTGHVAARSPQHANPNRTRLFRYGSPTTAFV